MGKFPFPLRCCSCTCFSSSSRHPEIAGPSTTTSTDLDSFLRSLNDVSQLDVLIKFIEDRLKSASGEKCEGGSSSEVASYIHDGQTLLEFVDNHIDKHIDKLSKEKDTVDGLSAESKKIITSLLKGAGKIHWLGAAFSVLGFVLSRFDDMSKNQKECLEILKAMVNLGKQIKKLDDHMPEQKQKLNEAVEYIVVGCCLCTSQLASSQLNRFLTTSVNADRLKAFQSKIDRLYNDLALWVIIDIQERLPNTAPQSQEIYANEAAVGIHSARDEVIRLLDFSEQHTSARVVVVHGLGGIGKTTLSDAVYAHIDLHTYKRCRVHMDQNCTKNDLKVLQEQILKHLFQKNLKLENCDHGRGLIKSHSVQNPHQPLFLYIDNGLKSTDLEHLLPADLDTWLPLKSRIFVTTRNLQETDMFVSRNIQRKQYAVNPLPDREARKILLKKVPDYNDEKNIEHLLHLCGGAPLLLELAGSQLAINSESRDYIVLDELKKGEKVGEEGDISDRMVDFVYHRLLPPIKEAFLDIACFLRYPMLRYYRSRYAAINVGAEEFRALEEASLVKTDKYGSVIVHDIVQARGRKMSEGSRITNQGDLLECLKDEKKFKNLKGIYLEESSDDPPIEISEYHLNCMSNSLRILLYDTSDQITFNGKCHRAFKQLRHLTLPWDISDLPMEFEKLERLVYYEGPLTQGMSLYKLPQNLRDMLITNIICSESGIANSKNSPQVAQDSALLNLVFRYISAMQRLPDGVETLTKLEKLTVLDCHKLRELPSKIGELTNLKELNIYRSPLLLEWPLSFGDLSKLKLLDLGDCSSQLKQSIPESIKQNCKIIS